MLHSVLKMSRFSSFDVRGAFRASRDHVIGRMGEFCYSQGLKNDMNKIIKRSGLLMALLLAALPANAAKQAAQKGDDRPPVVSSSAQSLSNGSKPVRQAQDRRLQVCLRQNQKLTSPLSFMR